MSNFNTSFPVKHSKIQKQIIAKAEKLRSPLELFDQFGKYRDQNVADHQQKKHEFSGVCKQYNRLNQETLTSSKTRVNSDYEERLDLSFLNEKGAGETEAKEDECSSMCCCVKCEPNLKGSLQRRRTTRPIHSNLASAGPLLLTISTGMTLGYSAVLLPQLQIDTNEIRLTRDQESWVASMAALPMAFGAILGGFLSEKVGRKTTHILACLPLFIGWLMIYLTINIDMLLAGRFLTGLCAGVFVPATGVYIGEICQPSHRGFLLGAISLSVSTGLFLIHLLGTYLNWRTTACIASTFSLVSWALLLLSPESPSWLIRKGWLEKAEDSFYWFRGVNPEAKVELDTMLKNQAQQVDAKVSKSIKQQIKGIFVSEFLKPLGYLILLTIFVQGAGINAVNFYSVNLIKKTVPGVNSYTSTLIIDVIRIFASVLSCFLLRRCGRRPLILYVGSLTSLTLLSFSLFSFVSTLLPQFTSHIYLVPLICLILYTCFVSIAFVAVPWALLGELLPLTNRSIGSGVASFSSFVSVFAVVKTMPHLFDSIGVHGTFLVYGMFGVSAVCLSYFCLYETRGKTLNQIEEFYKSYKGNDSDDNV